MNLTKLIHEEVPKVIPIGWQMHPVLGVGAIYCDSFTGLRILYSVSKTRDRKKYHHVSFSRQDRIPSWEEMRDALYELPFLDKSREIFMTLPPKDQYINCNSNVMHWWQEID